VKLLSLKHTIKHSKWGEQWDTLTRLNSYPRASTISRVDAIKAVVINNMLTGSFVVRISILKQSISIFTYRRWMITTSWLQQGWGRVNR